MYTTKRWVPLFYFFLGMMLLQCEDESSRTDADREALFRLDDDTDNRAEEIRIFHLSTSDPIEDDEMLTVRTIQLESALRVAEYPQIEIVPNSLYAVDALIVYTCYAYEAALSSRRVLPSANIK